MAMGVAEPSVRSLFIEMQFEGQPLATGTGFVVLSPRGPVLVTNRHNLTGRHQQTGVPLSKTGGLPKQARIVHNRLGRFGHWVDKVEELYSGDDLRWIEHPLLGPRADIVALPLTQPREVQLYVYDPASPGSDIRIGPADVVSVVGFPFGMRANGSVAIWATGFVASEPELHYGGLPQFLIDYRSRQGQSGSAVIAFRSGGMVATSYGGMITDGPVFRFLGIYSGRVSTDSDLGIVWKASAVAELIAAV
jgi:hypothetical protein